MPKTSPHEAEPHEVAVTRSAPCASKKSAPPTWKDAVLLSFISSLGPFAANTYVPSFGLISRELGVSMVAVQQSLSIYLAMFAVASLFVGAISDALGRKPVILGGTFIFAAASVVAMFSESMATLYVCRVVQGICASTGPVVTQAVIRDRWQGADAARLLGLNAILFALAPALAPIIGGWITVHCGWRWVFAFLAFFNLSVCSVAFFFLRESLPKERRQSFRPAATAKNYAAALRSSAFLAGVVGHGFCFLGGIVYSAGAADFVLHIMKMNVDDFGWLMVPLVSGTMLGGWLGPRIMQRIGSWRLIFGGILILIFSGVCGVALEWAGSPAYPLVILFPMVYNFAMTLVRPVMNVMNLDYFPKNRGMAASIQQFFQTSAFCLSSAVLVPIVMGEAWKYSAVMLGAGLLCGGCWLVVRFTREACLPKAAEG